MWLWSSTGASSCRENVYSGQAAAMTSSDAADDRPAHLQRAVEQPRVARGAPRRSRGSRSAVSRPSLPCACTKRELITGESVTATMPDTTTAAASVIANSRNSEPVSPPWKPIGV